MTAEMDVDRHIWEAFFADRTAPGVLVEVGAARPDYLSISASFRRRGWKVVAVEPNPDFCAAHRAQGYEVHQFACSDSEADDVEFFVVDSRGAEYLDGKVSFESFSSLGIKDDFAALHETVKDKTNVRTVPVKVRKLDTILSQLEPDVQRVDVLAVDVEGWELNVMRGFSIERYKPRVIILENLFKSDDYVRYMKDVGFDLWQRLEPNDIYVERSLMLAKAPPSPGGWVRSLMNRLTATPSRKSA